VILNESAQALVRSAPPTAAPTRSWCSGPETRPEAGMFATQLERVSRLSIDDLIEYGVDAG
jgi:hypothetical protein